MHRYCNDSLEYSTDLVLVLTRAASMFHMFYVLAGDPAQPASHVQPTYTWHTAGIVVILGQSPPQRPACTVQKLWPRFLPVPTLPDLGRRTLSCNPSTLGSPRCRFMDRQGPSLCNRSIFQPPSKMLNSTIGK